MIDPPGEVLAAVGVGSMPLTTTAWTWLSAIVRATVVRSVSGLQLMMPAAHDVLDEGVSERWRAIAAARRCE